MQVAGNETGISTFQLDIKSEGLTLATLERALLQVSHTCSLSGVLHRDLKQKCYFVLMVRKRKGWETDRVA